MPITPDGDWPPVTDAIIPLSMELFCRFDFAAARHLPNLPVTHPCQRLHGHTFLVELVIRGEIDAASGWIVDFEVVDRLTSRLKADLDHRYLNEIVGLENPTTEILARWLWHKLALELAGLYCITVQEHPSRGVTYYGPAA